MTTILSSLLIFLLAVLLADMDPPRVEDLRGTGDVTGTAHGMTALVPPSAEIYTQLEKKRYNLLLLFVLLICKFVNKYTLSFTLLYSALQIL
jgi:hypothetical protein